MTPDDLVAERFEAHRERLRGIALRMLGSSAEADDAVQETWLRLSRTDAEGVDNLGGWLTTVVGRICIDLLRTRTARREDPLEDRRPDPVGVGEPHPEDEAVLADAVGTALLVVLETLAPAERLAFVLHDTFAVPFDEVADLMGRSPAAVRQLASRARRRVQAPAGSPEPDRRRHREVVEAFLAASRAGDFAGLLALLDPDAVMRADAATVTLGSPAAVHGAHAVAETFAGRARAARVVLLDGYAAAAWSVGGAPKVVFGFTVEGGRVQEVELLADPELVAGLDLRPLEP
jgi:RNA polymerase sigma factor (sigma-70 family)